MSDQKVQTGEVEMQGQTELTPVTCNWVPGDFVAKQIGQSRGPAAPRFAPFETWDSTDAGIVRTQLNQTPPLDRPPNR